MGRTEMFAVYVALGDAEMLNYALESVLRGEKKHFVQVASFCSCKSLGSQAFVNNPLPD